jgi:predicted RNase H-like HicB family nuclease
MSETDYEVIIEEGDTSFGAYVPDLPGCVAVSESR